MGGGSPLKSVLLVDDSRFMRQANEKALARAGYDVVTASDGEEALRMAHSKIPDLILLDMLLPRLGGQEVLQALRSDPVTASIPVVVLSSLPEKNAAKLIREGATAYFEKSKLDLDQNAESLLQIVRKALDGCQESAARSARRLEPLSEMGSG
jgi:CheY-like chemotaxis protein